MVIVSNDGGFDSLVTTISAQGRKIIRLTVHGDPEGDRIFQSAVGELGGNTKQY